MCQLLQSLRDPFFGILIITPLLQKISLTSQLIFVCQLQGYSIFIN